jgi:hypothetical protein
MASGGEVKHFYNGGYSDEMGMTTGMITPMSDTQEPLMSAEYQKYFKEYQKELEKRMKSQKALPPSLQAPSLKTEPIRTQRISDGDNVPYVDGNAPSKPSIQTVAPAKTPEVTSKTPMELFLEQNAADREALLKQRSEDRNMALLAAGLGMMGGESPYAFANIGKGALSGVSYLSDANKQRAATQAALDRNRVAAMHYQNIGDYYKSGIQSKEDKLAQQTYDRAIVGIRELEKNIEAAAARNVAQMKGIDELIDPAKRELLMQRERARLQALAEPQLRSLYKRADIAMPDFSPTSTVQSKADAILKGK